MSVPRADAVIHSIRNTSTRRVGAYIVVLFNYQAIDYNFFNKTWYCYELQHTNFDSNINFRIKYQF